MDSEKKDPILEAARKDKYAGMEFEHAINDKSMLLSAAITLTVGLLLFFVEYFKKDTVNYSLLAILTTAMGVQFFYEGLKRKTVWKIIVGAAFTFLALLLIAFCLLKVLS